MKSYNDNYNKLKEVSSENATMKNISAKSKEEVKNDADA